ncbi:MAG UNVERIFIED_CONTAM: tetratricopeptide repeat protein [Rickettsiaceae bacterium]|jgi:tetratricopeptide (TPR) repeat protein
MQQQQEYPLQPGLSLLELGKFQEALEFFDNYIGQWNPIHNFSREVVDALGTRGEILYKMGRYDEAIKSFDRVLLPPYGMSKGFYNYYKGVALKSLGRYDEAIKSFDRSTNEQNPTVYSYHEKGLALKALG